MPEENDSELVSQAKRDRRLFGLLYTKYLNRVYQYCWKHLGHSRALAEDFVQETFLRAFRQLPKFTDRSLSYLRYLLRISHNLVVSYYRRQKPVALTEEHDVPVEAVPATEADIDAKILWELARSLKPLEREALQLRYQQDLPVAAVAKKIGKSEAATKLILMRARRRLVKKAGHPQPPQVA